MDTLQPLIRLSNKLQSLKVWQLLAAAVLCSELLTFLLTSIISLLLWGNVPKNILIIGFIDSFVVSFIVAGIVIFFLKKSQVDEQEKAELIKSVEMLKVYEKHLQQSRAKYSDLFENANDAIFLVNSELNYTDVNQKAVELFGFSKDEFLKMKISDVIPKNQLQKSANEFKKLAEGDLYEKFIGKQITKDGRWIDIEVSSSPILQDGEYIGSRDIVRDISDRIHAETQLKIANENLESKVLIRTKQLRDAQRELIENAHLSGMADLATGILHNVGNVLVSSNLSSTKILEITKNSGIYKFAEVNRLVRNSLESLDNLINNDQKLRSIFEFYLSFEKELDSMLQEIQSEGKILLSGNELISEIIMSQQKYVKSDLLEEFCLIEDIVNDSLNILSSSLAKFNIKVEKEFSKTLPVLVQKAKIVHIIINLIKNATEAITAAVPDQGKTKLVLTSDSEKVLLQVIDNGCGIDKDSLPKLFTRGFTTKEKGHGIGLHESFLQITKMGGKLWAESDGSDKGSTFCLELPIRSSETK